MGLRARDELPFEKRKLELLSSLRALTRDHAEAVQRLEMLNDQIPTLVAIAQDELSVSREELGAWVGTEAVQMWWPRRWAASSGSES